MGFSVGMIMAGGIVLSLLFIVCLIFIATVILGIIATATYFQTRKNNLPFRETLLTGRFKLYSIIVSIGYLFLIIIGVITLISMGVERHRTAQREQDAEEAKKPILLAEAYHYGEYTFPQGTLINGKLEEFMNQGDEKPWRKLTHVEMARFAEPTEIANVMGIAVNIFPARVELAEDQIIGPLHYRFQDNRWMVDETIPSLECKKGDIAFFHTPNGDHYDYNRPLRWPVEAQFNPNEWKFYGCSSGEAIDINRADSSDEKLLIKENNELSPMAKNQDLISAFEWYHHFLVTAEESSLKEAIDYFTRASHAGESGASYMLGEIYSSDNSGHKNIDRALTWYKEAVKGDNLKAMLQLGKWYFKGEVIEQDYEQVYQLFQRVAKDKEAEALHYLGMIYEEGLGVDRDLDHALSLYQEASFLRYMPSTYRVGILYEQGEFGDDQRDQAESWYKKACDFNYYQACAKLYPQRAKNQESI